MGHSKGGNGVSVTDDEIIRSVKLRFRVCNYLFRLGAIWFLVGATLSVFPLSIEPWVPDAVEITGGGIFLAAFAVTLAIYRCPVCDRYLSRFRPRKDQCPN